MSDKDLVLTEITARHFKRLTQPYKEYCIDKCMFLGKPEELPKEIKAGPKMTCITISGPSLPKFKNISVRYFGNWEKTKYGMQFKCITHEIIPPKKGKGMITYLSSSVFSAIKKTTIKKIIKEFGDEIYDVIKNDRKRLEASIGEEDTTKLINIFNATNACAYLFEKLGKYGVSPEMIKKIFEKYKQQSKFLFENNPYVFQEIGMSYSLCDKIALTENSANTDSYDRIAGAIICQIKAYNALTGNTAILDYELKKRTLDLLNNVKEERYEEVLKDMLRKNDKIINRNLGEGKNFYLQRSLDLAEHNITRSLLWFNNTCVIPNWQKNKIDKELEKYCTSSSIKLSDRQKEAVRNSLHNRLSVITGGPGTGKTTILTAILEVYKRVFGDCCTLMAPTGKAARRMTQSTKREATTIHSRIHIYDIEDDDEKNQPIYKGIVVIDETSMVDLLVMERLCSAIQSNKCHIVFVGDVDQLPSVGVGCVLSQLINSGVIPTTKLTEVFRQKNGGCIVQNAIRINRGLPESVEFNQQDFVFVEANSEEEGVNKIKQLYSEECIRVGVDNVALLTPLRRTQEGRFICTSDGLNPILQEVSNPRNDWTVSYTMSGGKEFRVNDRILQWKNTETSFNGDIGIIKSIAENDEGKMMFTVAWDNGNIVEISKDEMKTVDLGYSMSIHKSQGSEYQTVIIPMMASQNKCPIFKRNLIYTGVTRAKAKVIIVGDKKTFEKCCKDNDSSKRISFLANRLISLSKQSSKN